MWLVSDPGINVQVTNQIKEFVKTKSFGSIATSYICMYLRVDVWKEMSFMHTRSCSMIVLVCMDQRNSKNVSLNTN